MLLTSVLLGSAALLPTTFAYPGMGVKMSEIAASAALSKRDDPIEMIGDLKNGVNSATAKLIVSCWNDEVDCYDDDDKTYKRPAGAFTSSACKADSCCIWDHIQEELIPMFKDPSTKRCTQTARAAIRLGFHDAGQWSKYSSYGGADGSFILNDVEWLRKENQGLASIRLTAINLKQKYNVGAADLVQFMAKVAIVSCPLGPRMRFFTGRVDNSKAAPTGLLPSIDQNSNDLVKLFQDKTIGPGGLVALVGAHSTSQQFFQAPLRSGQAQDPSPGVWDASFYNYTLTGNKNNVFKFNSDISLSKGAGTAAEWKVFTTDPDHAQDLWNAEFAKAYLRLSLLGVNRINQMTDCTKVMPSETKSFPGFDAVAGTTD